MVEHKPAASPMHVSDADYWRERAIRTKRLAQRHDDQATRDYLMKIMAGYEEGLKIPYERCGRLRTLILATRYVRFSIGERGPIIDDALNGFVMQADLIDGCTMEHGVL
jgi:hypothetical protein